MSSPNSYSSVYPKGQSHWYLLTGLLIGLAAGLLFSLVISPVSYTDTDPSALSDADKSEFRQLVALAYRADGNLPRANDRLALLHDADPNRELAAQAQRMLGEGGSPDDARALAALAASLSGAEGPPPLPTQEQASAGEASPTPGDPGAPTAAGRTPQANAGVLTATSPRPTATPRPTFTPRPTATPPRVLDAPFTLTNQVQVCDGSLPAGRLAVIVTGRDGQPLAGVPLVVTWGEGQSSTFYTGLAPEISAGYADFQMTPGETYTLKVGEASETLSGLSVPSCGGGWQVEFVEGGG